MMNLNMPPSLNRDERWVRSALWAWAIFALALCIKILVEGLRHSVYGAFVSGPRDWWAGEVMYDDRGYYYSPTFSVLFTPFGMLPDWLGQMLWGLVSVGSFVFALRVFYRDVLPTYWPKRAEAWFLGLALAGSLRGIWSLQSNAVLMACVLLAAAAIVRQQWWRTAWLLALPVYIKVWPVVAAGLLAVQWPKKLISRVALTCAALALLPFATKVPTAVIDYYRQWFASLAHRQATNDRFTGYRDAWTIWEQFSTPVDARGYFLLQAGTGLAVLGFCLWLRRRERCAAEMATYTLAAWTCWQLLFGPGSERLTYLIAAPFAAWAVITSLLQQRDRVLAAAAFVTTFFLGMGGVERIFTRVLPSAVMLQPCGVILLAAWIMRSASRGGAWNAAMKPNLLDAKPEHTSCTLREAA